MNVAHTVTSSLLIAVLLGATVVAWLHQRAWFRHVSSRGATAFHPLPHRVLWSVYEANAAIMRGFTGKGDAWPPRDPEGDQSF